ncbi:MAG: FCD domain-containing protein [Aeromicrobium sp.]
MDQGSALGDSMLRPVRGHHAFESCVEQLATAIRLGVYEHGSMLPPERELAERLSVSRATLREAIAALRAAGFVTTHRGRGGGTVVDFRPEAPGSSAIVDRPREELVDALDFRRIVEPGAAYAAAGRELTETQKNTLRGALDAVNAATDPALHRQADSLFHLAIASLSASPLLIDAVTNVQKSLHDMLNAIPVLDRNMDHSRKQHGAIAKAILAGDAPKARRAMESHCDDTAALLRGLLREGER